MDEDHVNSIITFINNKRAAVARGEVENGPKNTTCKYLPPTNDMQNLSWSCSIEEETIAAMSPCGPTISKSVPEQHCDLFEKYVHRGTCDSVSTI
ncbi:hypothetical protein OESDEN_05161 [Oesophagostomum dentatum]|uniref:SCP domain-containing protein n=1 Tax=Oesophagostomum dentatum TaxID=61180 RepID=A0A0B1THK8_OESDE|nr:hypothetical protein OESDEN_05161 [Oesophagostomum dentatum]